MDHESVLKAPKDVLPMGFVASETSTCRELETAAMHCDSTGQVLVVNSEKGREVAVQLRRQFPDLRLRVDIAPWRRAWATAGAPHEGGEDIFGLSGWCELRFPVSAGIEAYTPSRHLRAADVETRQALLAETAEVPENIITRIAIEADVLDAKNRTKFFEDLDRTPRRRFAFVFTAKRDPLAKFQRLHGLRMLLARFPGVEIDHIDPLVAGDALAHGASWVGIGASSARRMPTRPGDKGGPPAAGFLPGLFHEDFLELRSPAVYADWFANAPSPRCEQCGRRLDMFDATDSDKARIVAHNIHQMTDHIGRLAAQTAADRPRWLRDRRLDAHARHMQLNPVEGLELNKNLHRFLELDDPDLRSMTPLGIWK